MQVMAIREKLRVVGSIPAIGKTVLGMDQSYTGFGFCLIRPDGSVEVAQVGFKPDPKRLVAVYQALGSFFQTVRPDFAAMEGYAFDRQQGMAMSGELGGVVRLCLHLCRIPFSVYTPGTLKKFSTGNGGAPKSLVVKEIYKNFGIDAKTDNEADAVGAALAEATRQGLYETTKARREVASRSDKEG